MIVFSGFECQWGTLDGIGDITGRCRAGRDIFSMCIQEVKCGREKVLNN